MSRETSLDNDALLHRHGKQVTARRLAVLRAVSDRPHSSAHGIFTAVRADIGQAEIVYWARCPECAHMKTAKEEDRHV